MKRETVYQNEIVKRLENEYPDCVVIKLDPRYIQGVPDLLILFGDRWAMLEVKTSPDAPSQPNQEHYVEAFGRMSYSSFIYPENEDEVFYELQSAFSDRR